MNFNLTDTEWHEVSGLTEGNTYSIQGKKGVQKYAGAYILFTQADSTPSDPKEGTLGITIKFTKGSRNVYVRSLDETITINVCVQEV